MGKISPDKILLKKGKWICRSDFIRLIFGKTGVGSAQFALSAFLRLTPTLWRKDNKRANALRQHKTRQQSLSCHI